MSADKPEAGRTCTPGCGDVEYEVGWCSDACRRAGHSLNPAPRPVEHPSVNYTYPEATCICRNDGSKCHHEVCQPRPVERCSCEESVALRKALKDIDKRIGGFVGHPGTTVRDIYDIARRALALGGE